MNILRMVARPLLAAPFIADGISAVRDPDPHVERAGVLTPLLERAGIEVEESQLRLATRVLGGVTTLAGVSLALGKGVRTSAAVLATVAVPLAVVNNPVWTATSPQERRLQRRGLSRSLALFGGLVIASTDRQGRPSATWSLRNRCQQRGELKQVRAQAWEDAQRVYQG
ncbi:MAG: DoxX family membrane protein [Actinomyces sp.]|nr:DoxX family membrane protein [Actinomyces sp.]